MCLPVTIQLSPRTLTLSRQQLDRMMKSSTMESEYMMRTDENRAPVSQQPHEIRKPVDEKGIGALIAIEINEKKLSVPLGTTILEACRDAA